MLATKRVNTGRQPELDLIKGLAILFMINIHVLWLFTDLELYETIFAALVYFMGGLPAAPVFMFAMGVGVVYSRRDNWKYFLKRGLIILLLGYLLNLLRFVIPFALGLELNVMKPAAIEASFEYSSLLMLFMEIDILQFAGLSLIFIALLKKIKLSIFFYPLLMLLPLLNYIVQDIQLENVFLNSLLGLFWGSGLNSTFPFLIWIFYPLLGILFGSILICVKNKNTLYLITGILGLLVLILVAPRASYLLSPDVYNYYHHGIFGNLTIGAFILFWLAIFYFAGKIIPNIIRERLSFWSRKITHMYLIHWLLIGWSLLLTGLNNFTIQQTIITMVIMIIVTDRLTYLFNQYYDLKI